jgi:mRNA-degrading endonuclease toxin of MazEF toxin-antitoxin module
MERGDIYLISADGAPGDRLRPVLIVSPGAFNRVTWTPIVVPITSGAPFERTAGFAVSLAGAGTRTAGVVHCDRPQAVDLTARGGRLVERAPVAVIDEVLARLGPIFA